MKKLMPLLIGLLGLGTGVGAGLALKPAPQAAEAAVACPAPAEGETEAAPCPEETPAAAAEKKPAGEQAYVALEKPFVVPVFEGEKAVALVVVSLSIETDAEAAHQIEAAEPRLRDSFLKVMFRHANSGGFDGSFTTGQKIEDLKSALLVAAREVMPAAAVEAVLITEIARQET